MNLINKSLSNIKAASRVSILERQEVKDIKRDSKEKI